MNMVVSRHAARGWEQGLCAMSHTPVGGHPQGWESKLADRSSLPPASGEEKTKSQPKHVFAQPHLSKMAGREETEGSSGSSARSAASPPYIRWARSLHALLDDGEGVRLFRKFVSDAGGLHVERLNFYFAVRGLRQQTQPDKIRQVVAAIYKFLRKSQLAMPEALRATLKTAFKEGLPVERTIFDNMEHELAMPEALRATLKTAFKEGLPVERTIFDNMEHELAMPEALRATLKTAFKEGLPVERTIFDNMEHEVTRAITETTYQAFLRSEAYVAYVSAATQPLSSPPDASPPPRDPVSMVGGLATLHEGEELPSCGGGAAAGPARLTHDALLATQSRRLQCDAAPNRKRWVYSAHAAYAGYCPGSRHDSSRASLSSGRADSDVVSLSGASTDSMSLRGAHREHRHRPKLPGLDKYAVINKEADSAMVIPRTQRIQSEQLRVLPPAEFAPLLIEKLERVRRDQESKERLERRLAEGDGEDASTQALPPQLVVAAIREKLQLDDDNDQDILGE
ncbi:regulator of G protein signaling domain-containing protein [Phthorimaea operculella]|nr:regulator of G protein signaling domain-containing protein [Phthorimaea operculella]